ncbi:MAG: (2Fe-2S)-binding protein [Deferribacterales bacterium]
MLVNLTVNGQKRELIADPGEFLSETLRKAGYLSVKQGCDTGSCGLCTVWVDEKPILSCAYLTARADGASITTIEGVREQAEVFAAFMADEGAEQCGFCLSGFVMTVLAMEKELKDPTEDEIQHYMAGCLCRCTGYMSQTRAVKKYLESKK